MLSYAYNALWFSLVHFKCKIINLDFFPGKIVTSLTDIFTMEKALSKIIFWHKIFICEPIFEIFVALFKTYGMQNGDMVIVFLEVFQKSEILKNAVS